MYQSLDDIGFFILATRIEKVTFIAEKYFLTEGLRKVHRRYSLRLRTRLLFIFLSGVNYVYNSGP